MSALLILKQYKCIWVYIINEKNIQNFRFFNHIQYFFVDSIVITIVFHNFVLSNQVII